MRSQLKTEQKGAQSHENQKGEMGLSQNNRTLASATTSMLIHQRLFAKAIQAKKNVGNKKKMQRQLSKEKSKMALGEIHNKNKKEAFARLISPKNMDFDFLDAEKTESAELVEQKLNGIQTEKKGIKEIKKEFQEFLCQFDAIMGALRHVDQSELDPNQSITFTMTEESAKSQREKRENERRKSAQGPGIQETSRYSEKNASRVSIKSETGQNSKASRVPKEPQKEAKENSSKDRMSESNKDDQNAEGDKSKKEELNEKSRKESGSGSKVGSEFIQNELDCLYEELPSRMSNGLEEMGKKAEQGWRTFQKSKPIRGSSMKKKTTNPWWSWWSI